jgi:L-amino acid N-acyltransferase YncA
MSNFPLIRQAVNEDLSQVLEIYHNLSEDPEVKISVDDAETKFEEFKEYPDYKLYVAERKNKIIGTFALLIMDNLAHRGEPSAIV